jgi:2'-5' RNA ligase
MRPLALLSDDDRRFLRDFETTAPGPEGFHHRDHLRAAWAALATYPLLEAMARYVEAIKRLAARAGSPGSYHETITLAYLLLIHERLSAEEAAEPFAAFAVRHADLLAWRPSILETYYEAGVLSSEVCRTRFVLPAVSPAASPAAAAPLSVGPSDTTSP